MCKLLLGISSCLVISFAHAWPGNGRFMSVVAVLRNDLGCDSFSSNHHRVKEDLGTSFLRRHNLVENGGILGRNTARSLTEF